MYEKTWNLFFSSNLGQHLPNENFIIKLSQQIMLCCTFYFVKCTAKIVPTAPWIEDQLRRSRHVLHEVQRLWLRNHKFAYFRDFVVQFTL